MTQGDGEKARNKTDKKNKKSLPKDKIDSDLAEQWSTIQKALKDDIGETAYRSWIAPLTLLSCDSSLLQIGTPTRFMRDWVQSHYADLIHTLWNNLITPVKQVEFLIHAKDSSTSSKDSTPEQDKPALTGSVMANQNLETKEAPFFLKEQGKSSVESLSSTLDPRFTFDQFVAGKSNELAYAAARRITETDTVSFNPLYIYGGVGLGKTHLMHAIAWGLKEQQSDRKILYLSAEKFMYQFIRALKIRDSVAFKEQFRSVDILMIDDIQFISGKESTQEEFFHTFNALMDQNKQIIVTSDKSPADLPNVDERLKSRLGWGLVADIHPTSYDLRLGILHAKCDQLGTNIPSKVLEFLAHKICSNVRELEGALNRIVAHAELVGRPVTIDYVQDVLQDLLRANNKKLTIDEIQKKVVTHFGIRMADMQSARRSRNVARPRQIAMYLAKILTTRSLPEIGRKFGGRDHTTVMHAVRKIEELCSEDQSFSDEVTLLQQALTRRNE